ncbi:COP9 signalosome complex subunit 9 homolog [Zeugodacus cucurbitae]|uniref:COP9 signalosome complex subunit 9 homolog n=1 Tax=Zeugodacus cucurbitae TaxID=28588 RepID=UPI00059681AF|nr:COP9 signalosome complex subunit 9 homolog [Zeugodacus cucurbitae]
MKPTPAADEMFSTDMEESGSSSGLLIDLPTNEKQVHADFYNDFDDLFDDDDDMPANTSG